LDRLAGAMHPLDVHWIYTFGSVALVAGASLIGILVLSSTPHRLSRVVPHLVSLAAGALLGTAFGHLLPESVERLGAGRRLSALLLTGFVGFFIVEKVCGVWFDGHPDHIGGNPHPHHDPAHPETAIHVSAKTGASGNRSIAANVLLGAAIHSFVDGMALATGYSASTHLGVITTVAVLLHEAPHHVGNVGILIHSGIPVLRSAVLSLSASGSAAVGALLVLLVGTRSAGLTTVLLPFTTANFLYISCTSLLPELQQARGLRESVAQTMFFLAGCALMFAAGGKD
jgi:zinc and cadmium transporter